MQRHAVSAIVPAEPRVVFRYLTEPALLPRWIEGLQESRPLGDGVMRVGARSIEVVEARGKTVQMNTEVIAFDPDRALTVRVTYPGAGDTDMTYELQAARAGTEVHLTVAPHYRGITRLLTPLIRASMRRRLQANLNRLAQVVEHGAL